MLGEQTSVRTTITQTGSPKTPWCVCWQTDAMPAPAYEYHVTYQQAWEMEQAIRRREDAFLYEK